MASSKPLPLDEPFASAHLFHRERQSIYDHNASNFRNLTEHFEPLTIEPRYRLLLEARPLQQAQKIRGIGRLSFQDSTRSNFHKFVFRRAIQEGFQDCPFRSSRKRRDVSDSDSERFQ